MQNREKFFSLVSFSSFRAFVVEIHFSRQVNITQMKKGDNSPVTFMLQILQIKGFKEQLYIINIQQN